MIVFVYGTSAEAIKIAPLARRLDALGVPYQQWLTMQHGSKLLISSKKLGFSEESVVIPNGSGGNSLQSPLSALKWIVAMFFWITRQRRTLRKTLGANSLIIVHGDTLTTVMGTLFAKILRIPSAHIEAGLRSGDWRNPFPEELDRRIAGIFATIHYVPTEEAVKNLKHKKNVIYTHGNTVIDAVEDAEEAQGGQRDPYAICLLHRYEFLSQPEQINQTLQTISGLSPLPVKLFVDDFSGGVLAEYLTDDITKKITPLPKLDYVDFVNELRGASFVITDSGGIQAEAAQLGIPTLIHRKATEQFEGIGENIVLSKWDQGITENFLRHYSDYVRPPMVREYSPTQIILEDLESRGFLKKTDPV